MQIEVLPAKAGDCLIIHCGTAAAPKLILVDGGPSGVWQAVLKDRLLALRAARGLAEDVALDIELVMVSHVDDDHVVGILALLEFIQQRVRDTLPPLFRIKQLWHNSFDAIIGNDETGAVLAGMAADDDAGDAAMVMASIAKGHALRGLAGALGIPINRGFKGALVQVGGRTPRTARFGGVSLTVVGPLRADLQALQKAHDAWLKLNPHLAGNPEAVLAGLDDESVSNLSSIVVMATHKGRRLLLTGDARSDKVLAGMEAAGVVAAGAGVAVDVLKMPHHGSIRNVDEDFFDRVAAETYVFCGDGKHGNPDRETLDMLLARRTAGEFALVVNHSVAAIDAQRKAEHGKSQARRVAQGRPPGPDWSDVDHSLGQVAATLRAGVTLVAPAAGAAPFV